jgi:hypothetical protein
LKGPAYIEKCSYNCFENFYCILIFTDILVLLLNEKVERYI